MRLPSGKQAEPTAPVRGTDIKAKLVQLLASGFSGYVALTVDGFDGFEEATLIIKQGVGVAAIYEYLKFELIIMGDYALRHFFNAAGADFGMMDIISLSNLQVDMAMAFDEKIRLSEVLDKKSLDKRTVGGFDSDFARHTLEQAIKIKQETGREDVLRKYGLGGIGG